MRPGVNTQLEEAADALLKESLEGVFSHEAKSDILTPWKDYDRHRREIYPAEQPERHLRLGMIRRVANRGRPDLNSRDGEASFARHRTASSNVWAWDAAETARRGTITLEEFKRREGVKPEDPPRLAEPSGDLLYCIGAERGHTVLDVQILRELFRQLQQWYSIYESDQVDVITGPNGEQYCLWDVEYLYKQLWRLPKRQREAIELYLVQNMREADAAVAMGVSATNPIGIYATVGLGKIIDMIENGDLPRFGSETHV
jgi:hypothetical protein